MPKPRTVYFLINKPYLEEYVEIQGIAGLMDMLRYDGARVECNAPAGYYLLSAPHVTEARWQSFNLQIAMIGLSPGELHDWAHVHPVETKARG